MFETKGSVCFPIKEDKLYTLIGYLNSPIVVACLQTLSPTLDYHEGPMGKVPYEDIEDAQNIENLVKTNIEISKSDWDSHETSWDFQQNELISLIDCTERDLTIESLTSLGSATVHSSTEVLQSQHSAPASIIQQHCIGGIATPQADESPRAVRLQDLTERYHQKWNTLFMQLHANEEELNRQFIDIYGLQDELTSNVPLDEITILQQGEISIENE